MKILVVEDDRELSRAIKRLLEFNKYEVDVAFDGLEALDKVYYNEYDALILDYMMPKMDGITTLKTLRANDNNIPVLMLTAKASIDDKVEGLDAGADDYLTKPFQIKELLARVRALLRRKGEVISSIEFGDFTLDPNTAEVISKDKRVNLTNKEYQLLELFIRNKNVLLSTEKIMNTIWDFDSQAEINVVWQFISNIRKKLKLIGSNYTIQAVRGIGYRLGKNDDKEA
ncbi:MAG: response regulator transcription factor [Bacilli bacterium]|nr:response regulator transcription factor [Bacilli bacterium]